MSAEVMETRRSRSSIGGGFGIEIAASMAVLLAIAFVPLLLFPYPGLQDYPNHLARAFILLNQDDPVLAKLYGVQWTTIPNLGWDLWAVAVGRLLPLEWTGKLYLALSSAAIMAGCFALNRAVALRWTIAPLLAVPFLFNAGFARGFLNFELGAGCALLAAAWWVWSGKMHWLPRLLLATICCTTLYTIHLYAWAFYGLFVLGYELQQMVERREPRPALFLARLVRDGLQAAPVPFMLFFSHDSSSAQEATVRAFQFPFVRIFHVQHLIDLGHPVVNCILVVIFALIVGAAVARLRWFEVRRNYAFPIALSVALFFLLPDQIGETFYVAWRVLLLAVLVAIASLVPTKEGEARSRQIAIGIAMLTIAISAANTWSWRNAERGREAFIELTRDIPDGSAVFVVHSGMRPPQLRAIGLYHVGAFAVLTKRALVQSMFALPGQQPLRFRDQWMATAPRSSFTFLADAKREFRKYDADLASHLLHFDYVVIHGPDNGDDLLSLSQRHLALIRKSEGFRLYRVDRKPLTAETTR
ncbi:MAG: hypothetical protein KIT82_14425 [Bradyrhizobium sp.]|nr:hypothetical protein [Bradyrhizobium sp.]